MEETGSTRRSEKLGPRPVATSPATTSVMKGNRSANTGPEKLLRKELRSRGITGYRLNWKKALGKPDIAFPGRKLAVFVHGCFWHSCPRCDISLPKSNKEFWERKLRINKERDAETVRLLKEAQWTVLEIWECEIKDDPESCGKRVQQLLA